MPKVIVLARNELDEGRWAGSVKALVCLVSAL